MSLSIATDIDAKRATLDQQILALQLQLSDLRSQRNTLAPISSLPADILINIFLSTDIGLAPNTYNTYNACVVSWVCRFWRNVAINSQALWSLIDSRNPKLVRLCLERAPSIPLKFHLLHFSPEPEPTQGEIDLLSTIISELGRTSKLCLRASLTPLSSTLYLGGLSLHPAPIMRSLSLEGMNLPEGTQMFAGIPPPLHTLSLSYCHFQWNTHIFQTSKGLTRLTIRSPRTVMSLGGFLDVLRQIPRLQVLRLDNAFGPHSSFLPPLGRTAVHLPDLKLLRVEGCSTIFCPDLLSGLTFTNKTVVKLYLHDETVGGGSGLPNILQALNSCTAENSWHIDTISLVHAKGSHIQLLSEKQDDWVTTKEVFVHISIASCIMDAAEMIHALLALNRDNIETVILNTTSLDITIPDTVWQRVFGGLPNLTKIKVRNGYANSFVDYLAREGGLIAELTSASPVPYLTNEQAQEYVNFKSVKLMEIYRFSEHNVKTNFADLLLAMTLRKQYGVNLVGMAFASCHFHEFNVWALGGVIRDVHVGFEQDLEGGEDSFIMPS